LTRASAFDIIKKGIKSWADARANLPRPARWFPERGCGPRQLKVVSVVSPPRKRRRVFCFRPNQIRPQLLTDLKTSGHLNISLCALPDG
jgi:hypothetical protein